MHIVAVAVVAGLAGVLHGLYGPLVFHDGFLLRDGPVAHLSTLLLAWPLIARARSEENEKISSNEEEGVAERRGKWRRDAAGAFLLGLLGGGVGEDDARSGLGFVFQALDDHAIVQRTNLHKVS